MGDYYNTTIYLSDQIKRSGAISGDISVDAEGTYTIYLTFAGGRVKSYICARHARVIDDRGRKEQQMKRAWVVQEFDGQVMAEVHSIVEAERLIGLIEDVDADAVHAGAYGVLATEEAEAEYQRSR